MASSQVEYAAANPFGCVLRDHNSRRDRKRDANTTLNNPSPKTQTNSFQRNFKDLVRDHLQSCISLSPRALSSHEREEYSEQQCGGFSCFGGGTHANSSRTSNNQVGPKGRAQAQSQLGPKAQAQAQNQNQTSFITGSAKKETREPSPTRSEGDISVSSLVRKWRGFEANHVAGLTTPTSTSAATNSPTASAALAAEVSRADSGVSTSGSTVTMLDETSSVEGEETEEKEKERIRVADIVKKWSGDESGACLARLKIVRENNGKGEGEGKTFSPRLVSSPRIRGRQAIVDVFMKMERERYREIELLEGNHAVTKFPQRGRIQALLRLKFLRRDQTVEEQQRPPLPSKAPAVTSLREKFDSSADQDSVSSRTTKETPNTSHQDTQRASTSKDITEQTSPKHEPIVQRYLTHVANHEHENASESSKHSIDHTIQISDKESDSTISPKAELNIPSHSNSNENCESQVILHENGYEEDASDVNMGESEGMYNEYWEQGEAEDYYCEDIEGGQYYYEPNLDWITDIARPRSYWEDLRQAWYREVLNTKSKNEEIRQLLERGSVSNVLASDFKERMDRLLRNSVQGATRLSSYNQVEEDSDNEHSVLGQVQEHVDDARQENRRQLLESGCVSAILSSDFRERMDQLVKNRMQRETPSSVIEEQNKNIPTSSEQIEDDKQEDNEEEDERESCEIAGEREDENSVAHRYQNVGDFYEQNSTPSPLHWSHEEKPSPFTSYTRSTHEGSSSFKNPTIEMELIYDLRSHMELLYREMAELRKSVTSCIDMQMKMQHFTREKISAAIICEEQAEKKDSNRRKPKKGTCCICYEKKVDSLLYRCGHMCTCFTCANELQWGSGKCPICRAQIIDVVRAYPDL